MSVRAARIPQELADYLDEAAAWLRARVRERIEEERR
jgi:hypothetical protein